MSGAPIPTLRTWSVGDIDTAALMNANVRDPANFLLNVPVFYGYQATPQSVPNTTFTLVSYDTNVYDTYGGHSTSVNNTRYVAQVAGIYMVVGRTAITFNAGGARGVGISYNGGGIGSTSPQVFAGPPTVTPTSSILQVLGFQQMAAGDYIEVMAYQSAGGPLSTIASASALNVFWMHS